MVAVKLTINIFILILSSIATFVSSQISYKELNKFYKNLKTFKGYFSN